MSTQPIDPFLSDEMAQTRQFRSLDDLLQTDVMCEYTLRIQGEGHDCLLDLAPILIGRDPSCNLVIRSSMISRFHCVIYRAGRHTVIRDLHSTNGVFLNQVRVFQAPLRVGDEFQLGDLNFRVVLGTPRQQEYASACAVVFMDIANSTSLTEHHGEIFSQTMHQEISRVEDQIFWNQGFPIKHLGDGLMSAFGIWPSGQPDYSPADAALRAALMAIEHMRRLGTFPDTRLRVGLAYGEVIIRQQENFDLFGDTVNLASRVEFSNKLYGTQLMMSDGFLHQLSNREGAREVDLVRVKGRQQPVKLFTWDGRLLNGGHFPARSVYHMGLQQYRRGNLALADQLFTQAAEAGDAPGRRMQERVHKLQAGALPPEWDGIWQLDEA